MSRELQPPLSRRRQSARPPGGRRTRHLQRLQFSLEAFSQGLTPHSFWRAFGRMRLCPFRYSLERLPLSGLVCHGKRFLAARIVPASRWAHALNFFGTPSVGGVGINWRLLF